MRHIIIINSACSRTNKKKLKFNKDNKKFRRHTPTAQDNIDWLKLSLTITSELARLINLYMHIIALNYFKSTTSTYD